MLNISLILRTFTPCISCCDVLFHSFRTWDCLKTGEIANGGDFGAKSSRVGPETPPVRRTSTDSSTGSCRRPAEIKKERLIIIPMAAAFRTLFRTLACGYINEKYEAVQEAAPEFSLGRVFFKRTDLSGHESPGVVVARRGKCGRWISHGVRRPFGRA